MKYIPKLGVAHHTPVAQQKQNCSFIKARFII